MFSDPDNHRSLRILDLESATESSTDSDPLVEFVIPFLAKVFGGDSDAARKSGRRCFLALLEKFGAASDAKSAHVWRTGLTDRKRLANAVTSAVAQQRLPRKLASDFLFGFESERFRSPTSLAEQQAALSRKVDETARETQEARVRASIPRSASKHAEEQKRLGAMEIQLINLRTALDRMERQLQLVRKGVPSPLTDSQDPQP